MQCDENAEEKVVPHDGEEDECSDSGYFYGCRQLCSPCSVFPVGI